MSKLIGAVLFIVVCCLSCQVQAQSYIEHEGFYVPLFMVDYIPSNCGDKIVQKVEYETVCLQGRICKVPVKIYRTCEYIPTCSPIKPCCLPSCKKPACQPRLEVRRICEPTYPVYNDGCNEPCRERQFDLCGGFASPCEIVGGLVGGGVCLIGKGFEGAGCLLSGFGEMLCCNPFCN